MAEINSLRNEIRNAVEKYDFCINNQIGSSDGDIIKRRVIGYAAVQFNYVVVQPDDSAKYIQTIPLFENSLLDDYIDYDIKLPNCANVINIFPVTKNTVAIFGGVPDNDTTLDDLVNDSVCCNKYTLLGIETNDPERHKIEFINKLKSIWTNKIFNTISLIE